MPLGISLSTDFRAFSRTKKVWRGLPGIFIRCVVLFLSFFSLDTVRQVVFSKGEERRFGEGLLGLKKVTLIERQTCFLNVNLLLSGLGVWAG